MDGMEWTENERSKLIQVSIKLHHNYANITAKLINTSYIRRLSHHKRASDQLQFTHSRNVQKINNPCM